jgi:hypothetical protein
MCAISFLVAIEQENLDAGHAEGTRRLMPCDSETKYSLGTPTHHSACGSTSIATQCGRGQ